MAQPAASSWLHSCSSECSRHDATSPLVLTHVGWGKSKAGQQTKAPTSIHGSPSASYEVMKTKRAWDLAFSPAKSLPMQAFMLYMSGGGVQIFSMGIVFMLLSSPFKNLAGMNTSTFCLPLTTPEEIVFHRSCLPVLAVFAPLAPTSPEKKHSPDPNAFSTLALQKLVYLLCNLLTLALGLWKCRSMGLLPTGTGDWLAFETRGPVSDVS